MESPEYIRLAEQIGLHTVLTKDLLIGDVLVSFDRVFSAPRNEKITSVRHGRGNSKGVSYIVTETADGRVDSFVRNSHTNTYIRPRE